MLEEWLWDRNLDYDGYESSKAEEVHSIMCNEPRKDSTNGRLLAAAWSCITDEEYRLLLTGHRDRLKDELQEVEQQLCN
jgi:hypothetical protein